MRSGTCDPESAEQYHPAEVRSPQMTKKRVRRWVRGLFSRKRTEEPDSPDSAAVRRDMERARSQSDVAFRIMNRW